MFGEGDAYRDMVRDLVVLEEQAAHFSQVRGYVPSTLLARISDYRAAKRLIDIRRAWTSTSLFMKCMSFIGFARFPEEYL